MRGLARLGMKQPLSIKECARGPGRHKTYFLLATCYTEFTAHKLSHTYDCIKNLGKMNVDRRDIFENTNSFSIRIRKESSMKYRTRLVCCRFRSHNNYYHRNLFCYRRL